jgi:hypothetical protein
MYWQWSIDGRSRTNGPDHPPSEPTITSTPEAQPLIDSLDPLYP